MAQIKIGIYELYCKDNDKSYIGLSSDIKNRWYHHKSMLRLGKHDNIHVQRVYDKYGPDAFEYSILEECEEQRLEEKEKYWESEIGKENLLNIAECGEKNHLRGRKMTEEQRKAHGLARLGKKLPPGTGDKISAALMGKPRDEETRRKISLGNLGKQKSEEHVLKMCTSVTQYNFDGSIVKVWKSGADAHRAGFSSSRISLCVQGIAKSHKNFIWKYTETQ